MDDDDPNTLYNRGVITHRLDRHGRPIPGSTVIPPTASALDAMNALAADPDATDHRHATTDYIDEPRRTKVHKITLLIVDHDEVGVAGIATILKTARYPNHCITPQVMASETREVDWTDAHPLNDSRYQERAFAELFVTDSGDRKP